MPMCFYLSLSLSLFFFSFWPYLQYVAVPGPGIELTPQLHWILNLLNHKGILVLYIFIIIIVKYM